MIAHHERFRRAQSVMENEEWSEYDVLFFYFHLDSGKRQTLE